MDDWVISNFCFCKQDSNTFSTPLCKDFYKINSKKWNCWVNSMSILSFSNTAKFLFRKVFSVGTITSRGCYLLPAFLERQCGREGILAGTWKWLGYGEAEKRRQCYGGVSGVLNTIFWLDDSWEALTGLRKAVRLLGYVLLQSKDTDQNQQREKAQGGSPGEARYKLLGVLPSGVLWGQT